ncbi:porin [Amphritea sp. 1_MG-2023]|uniref:porin n=1 Tax=Amphritea sp. 1_MG-2023 TaxID=3062670 RepID=UPI0026E282CF|nr:porin [Amphritea sp. 1_MG-2023]MDO6561861.1 porin [Amphritea sp. 1_MG-2023]
MMNRVALTTAIAAAMLAGSVQAATIYEDNGLKYELKGDLQVQLRQKIGDNQDQDLEFDDLELKNRVTYRLNDGMSAFAQLDYSFDKRANDQSSDSQDGGKLEEAYLGLSFNNIDLRVGKQNYSTDEFSVEKAYETVVEDDIFDLHNDQGDDVIRVDAQFENLFVSVSTDLKAEGNGDSDDTESTDLFVSTELGNLGLMAAYQTYQELGADSVSAWGVGVTFDAGFAQFGADYGSMEDTADVYNLVASFPIAETTTVAVGVQNRDEDAGDDITGWYANATYNFPEQKAVSVFGEIGDTDADDTDPGYLVGMRIVF